MTTNKITVTANPTPNLRFGDWQTSCAIGRNGVISATKKREGDGCTPLGLYPLRTGFAQPDKFPNWPDKTRFEFAQPTPTDIWDDDPQSPTYNQLISLDPSILHNERLSRTDGAYDVIIPIGYNDAPPKPGRGSAIFIHVATSNLRPTAGCIALPRAQIIPLIEQITPYTRIEILPD